MNSETTAPHGGFGAFALDPVVQRGIAEAGFAVPTPIQSATIPAVLAGRDVLGLAQTGTGKTAAFAAPILHKLITERQLGPRALIVAPTRELAQQIDSEFRLLGKFIPLRTATVYGGISERAQINLLRTRPDIIVACPGRLLALLRQRCVELNRISVLVLDEADHMFDMGFLPDVRRILAALPSARQNLLFSATMPPEIRGLATGLLRNPHCVELASKGPAETIEHAIYPVTEDRKLDLLNALLATTDCESAIVFSRTKHRAKRLALALVKEGHRAVALQGNMSQAQRDRAMEGFRQRTFTVLVATDIAARGIDVAKVSHVINYDVPQTPDAYTHRLGRTGRAERSGKAFTLATKEDHSLVRAIEHRIGAQLPRCRLELPGEKAAPLGTTHHWQQRDTSQGNQAPKPYSPHRATQKTGYQRRAQYRTPL